LTAARHLRIGNGKDAITTRATTPLQRQERHLRTDNNDTILTRAATPAQQWQDVCASRVTLAPQQECRGMLDALILAPTSS
jgi:hypothetical protein